MYRSKLTWLILLLWPTLFGLAQATTERLAPYSSVVGNLPQGGIETWSFDAVNGEIVSLIAESTSELDPVMSLLSETGAVLASQDDYDYPNSRDAALQAITIPFTGTYTVQVRAFGNTAGSYRLTRLRGYGQGADLNGFNGSDTWQPSDEALNVIQENSQLTLELAGVEQRAHTNNQGAQRRTDYYAQTQVNVLQARDVWTVHFVHHQQSDNRYYQFSINSDGLWRYLLQDGTQNAILQDWVSHPAIVPGETQFDLGILTNGPMRELFYNGSLLASLTDSTLDGGILGFGVETGSVFDAEVAVTFDNLRVTTPLKTSSGADLLPDQLVLGNPNQMTRALERRRLIPAGGTLSMNVPESSTQSINTGVSQLPLGRGTTFRNFALSSEVTINTLQEGINGCGLFLRNNQDNYLLAYIDQVGGYALAERNADEFLPGVFGEQRQLGESEHHLLLIASEEQVRYYIDGRYRGEIRTNLGEGTIGNAVVNYDPNTTTCNFENTWLWSWDSQPIE